VLGNVTGREATLISSVISVISPCTPPHTRCIF